MTQYMLKTTIEEADDIVSGNKSFIFRSDKHEYGYGDYITFQPYKAGKSTRHAIEKLKFCVTHISKDAPIEKGWKIIGFRRLK